MMASKKTFPAVNNKSLAEVKEILDSTGLHKFFRLDIQYPQPADRWQDLPGKVRVTDKGLYFRRLGKLVSNEECARALHLENQELSFRPPKFPKRLSQEELKRFISMKDHTSSTLLYTEFFDKPLKRWAIIMQRRVLIRGASSSIPSRAMRAVLEIRDHPERVLGWWMWSMDRVRGVPFHVMALFVLNRSLLDRPSVVDTQQSTTDPVQRQRGPVLETKPEFADEVEQEDEVKEDEVKEEDEVEEEDDFILSIKEDEVEEKDEVEEQEEVEEDDFILSIDDTLDNTQELKRKFEERQRKVIREKRQLVDLEEKLSKLKRKFQERRRQEKRQLVELEEKLSQEKRQFVELEEKLSQEKREKKQLEEKLSQAQREKSQLEEKLSQAPDVWKEANNELLEHVDRLRKHFHQVRRDIAEQMTKRVSIFDDVGEKMAKRVKRNEQCIKVPKREETDGYKTQFSSGQSSS